MGPSHFVFLLLDGFPHISLSCAIEPLRLANHVAGAEIYRWSLASLDGGAVTASNGLSTPVGQGLMQLERREKLLIVAGDEALRDQGADLGAWLRTQRARGAVLGGICSGAYPLARAGLLSGREAAIHWAYHDAFSERFPNVRLTRSLYVADALHPTCSGGMATLDLLLHMIFQDHGRDLAVAVAEQLVCSGMRDGKSLQRFSAQFRHGVRNSLLARAIARMNENIETPMQAHELAEELGISCRQLERIFAKHLDVAPMRYWLELRLGRARNLLLQSEASVSEIAVACGFSSMSHFSKVFRARFGYSPANERAVRAAAEPAPRIRQSG
ncbi:GlxA family transcriptional regulator [Tabrizicola sp.]|uniref:GlxA family transcriptional regulator n=1 Tax=Tabrizicola sp. TaxID=2005166 RepID=UPI0035B2DE50